MVKGYKAFNKNMTNRYGTPFIVGETYHATGEISFGNDGNGFHMCKNLCDVFRYFPCFEEEICVAQVTGTGQIVTYEDDYNGYYDMYAVETITIDALLRREEIIAKMLADHDGNNCKFLATFGLNDQEKVKFLKKYRQTPHMLSYVLYYQYGIKEAFELNIEKKKELRKVLTYGQDNN